MTAREEAGRRWPDYPNFGFRGAADRQAAFVAGVAWALEPTPGTVDALAWSIWLAAADGFAPADGEWPAWTDENERELAHEAARRALAKLREEKS